MTLLPKVDNFVNETFMFDLVFKFYNQWDTIHCLFDPESCDVFKFLVTLKKFLNQEKKPDRKKSFFMDLCVKNTEAFEFLYNLYFDICWFLQKKCQLWKN